MPSHRPNCQVLIPPEQCTSCGYIIEFQCEKIERLQDQMARLEQFTIHSHRLEIFGLCEACSAGRKRVRTAAE